MILTVHHVTTYAYDAPMRSAVQSLRLFPSRFDGQRTIRWDVAVEGGLRGCGRRERIDQQRREDEAGARGLAESPRASP